MATLSVKHKFISAKGDGPDTTRVKPTNWNAEHDLVVDGDGVVLGRPAGAGPGPIVPVDASSLLPAGVILDFAGSVAPPGFLMCYGQLVSRTVEANLYAAIGTQYGVGDGSTTFRLPDPRGLVSAGKTDMGGADRGNLAGGNVLGAQLGGQNSSTGNIHSVGNNNINFGNVPFVQTYGNVDDTGTTIGNGTGATVAVAPPNSHVTVQGHTPLNAPFGIAVDGASNPFSIVQGTIVFNKIIKR